jgi:hypothetical protein
LVDFVADQDDGDVVTDACQVLVPLRDVFVGDSGGDIEHENGSIGSNIIAFSEPTEFFLPSSIPK